MGMVVVTGELMNHLERMVAPPVLFPGADPKFPPRFLWDGLPSIPLLWGAVEPDSFVAFDFNVVPNGGFEAPDLEGWTDASVGPGNTCVATTAPTEVNEGVRALRMAVSTTGAANRAGRFRDIRMRAGERFNVTVAVRGNGTAAGRVRIRNLQTGRFLAPSGLWQASPVDVAARAQPSYQESKVLGLRMEPMPSSRPDLATMTLRLEAFVDGAAAGFACVDSFYVWPSTDVVAAFGHNFDPQLQVELRRAGTGLGPAGSGELEAVLVQYAPAFYGLLPQLRDDRWWRVLLAGRNSARPFTGELVFSQKLVVLAHPSWPTKLGSLSPQVRSEGEERVYVSEDWERQTWSADIRYTSTEEFRQARDLIRRASQQGRFPMVFIPDDQDPEVCLFGRIPSSYETDQAFIDTWDEQEFTVKGLSLPTFVQ